MMNRNLLAFLMIIPLFFISCSDDDGYTDPEPTELNSKIYTLGTVGDFGVSGTAKFIENSDATLSIELDLQNTPAGGVHPAHIHFNTAVESGGIALTLEDVNGDTGESATTFTTLNDGTAITYQELIDFNGYINVHLSATELSTLVAQGDIGQNELTGETISYDLNERDVAGINGTVEFAKRVNQTTLVSINLTGTPADGSHPAHIHENDIATTGNIIVGLNPVSGDSGISKTQVSTLVGGAEVTYTELLTINAYVNVHLSDADLDTIVAQGNIGSNAGTDPGGAESKTYDVTNTGASAYIFNGEELSDSSNPDFTFKRGSTYTFNVTTPGHPFYINRVRGTGTANTYNSGVTNNGAISGTITFTVPTDAPDTLYYNCEFHSSMTGMITITD
ncbi:CHRD domain-containing protein [Psychroflexus sp. MES1-P1E]|uniref:CHRD domain-containing protein n=1 Tax=Psychroflexus sp. MES1-P1E TaxID=2058320 RepID=UPI002155CDEF|nr:CHRD domain-containing protein [Psychroflexus sp. MES1-P1E]